MRRVRGEQCGSDITVPELVLSGPASGVAGVAQQSSQYREHLLSTRCIPSTILGAELPGESAKVLALTERPFQ